MGLINIVMRGSFPIKTVTFSAMEYGHAAAVADAIKWLSGEALPAAIKQDHELHSEGDKPNKSFGKD